MSEQNNVASTPEEVSTAARHRRKRLARTPGGGDRVRRAAPGSDDGAGRGRPRHHDAGRDSR